MSTIRTECLFSVPSKGCVSWPTPDTGIEMASSRFAQKYFFNFKLYTHHIFALLPNKTQPTYNRFSGEVFGHTLAYGNGPGDILIDFEHSTINAISTQNPNIDIKGCFYHLCSNIWKHIQNFRLQERYKGDRAFALQIRMIAADVVPTHRELMRRYTTQLRCTSRRKFALF